MTRSLMFPFPFDQSSRRDTKILNHSLSFMLLMTIGFYNFLFKLRTVSAPFPIQRKTRMTFSTQKPLRLISSASILFGLGAMTFDAVGHWVVS